MSTSGTEIRRTSNVDIRCRDAMAAQNVDIRFFRLEGQPICPQSVSRWLNGQDFDIWLQKLKDDDLNEDYDDNVDLLRNAFKEAETRKMTVGALTNKVNVVKADVSNSEFDQLSNCVAKLSDNHAALLKKLKEFLEEECQGIEKKKKFQEDYDGAVAWIKVKSNEHIGW